MNDEFFDIVGTETLKGLLDRAIEDEGFEQFDFSGVIETIPHQLCDHVRSMLRDDPFDMLVRLVKWATFIRRAANEFDLLKKKPHQTEI